jgi:hypothetical protein
MSVGSRAQPVHECELTAICEAVTESMWGNSTPKIPYSSTAYYGDGFTFYINNNINIIIIIIIIITAICNEYWIMFLSTQISMHCISSLAF